MTTEPPSNQAEHTRLTRDAYDRLAPVWASTTDDGPFNGLLERPALRSLVPRPLAGKVVLDAGCGSGAQCEWLLNEGADVIGIDLSPAMVEETKRRCGKRARIFVADLAEPLTLEPGTVDGITCSLALHYLRDWHVPLHSFRSALRSTGWLVLSLDHPFCRPLPSQKGGYFDTELVNDTWQKATVEATQHFWRRPLSAVIEAFADAGFVIDRVGEPQPSPEALQRFPGDLEGVKGFPGFIVYRLLPRLNEA
ncbi:MAG TPA: class I SAM-dependent methyltransferase [Acidimicrobiales bacterium]